MHTFKQIIDNQKEFKDHILISINDELKETKDLLKKIQCADEYIIKEKNKFENKVRNVKRNHIEKLFFMNPNRDKEFYVWWDEILNEPLILRYE